MRPCLVAVWVMGLALFAAPAPAQAPGRSYTVEDVLRTEGIGSIAPSPDGDWIAVVIQRPRGPREIHAHYGLVGANARGDIWLVRRDGSELHMLTRGVRSGAGYWNPVWSPDGRWLAMLSTEGGGAVRAWVWQRGMKAVRRADARAVDLSTTTDGGGEFQALTWLDSTTLLLPLLLPGADSRFDPVGATMDATIRSWAAARAGVSPTASVLDTEQPPAPGIDGVQELVALDVRSSRARTIASMPRDPTTSGVRSSVPSPDGRWVMVQTSMVERPIPWRPLTRTMSRNRLGLVPTRGDTVVRWLDALVGHRGAGFRSIIRWSPDGSRVAIAGSMAGADEAPLRMFVVEPPALVPGASFTAGSADRTMTPLEVPGITPTDARWTVDGRLLILGKRGGHTGWWVVEAGGAPRAVLPDRRGAPELVVSVDPRVVYVVSDAGLSVLDPASGASRSLSASLPDGHARVIWPSPSARSAVPVNRLVVEVSTSGAAGEAGARGRYFEVALDGGKTAVTALAAPAAAWRVHGYLPTSRELLLLQRNARVGVVGPLGEVTLIRRNAFLDDVRPPRRLLIPYRGENGDSLHAVLLLPASYRPGKRYPTVTWVYAGTVYTDTSQVPFGDPYLGSWLNMMLLVSRGYAVLFPSMPLGEQSDLTRDVMFDLTAGVLPAVDRVIAMGIADPYRHAVMGQSFGGYSTLGLVTLTRRFRAAIAISGISNSVSKYGAFRTWDRWRDNAHLTMANPKQMEAGQDALAVPIWTNPWRYLVNSPLFHLHRVQTPVLLIHGDQDFAGIQQSEEFFTGMYRLGKRARFVRYWGDDHSLDSPANIRDMWQRVFAWLDETLDTPPPGAMQ